MNDKSLALRARLASVGIFLDDAKAQQAPPSSATPAPPIDREAIRAILAPLECPEWAIISCPSIEHARGYRPPAKESK